MSGVEALAEQALAKRAAPSADNPLLEMQEQFSKSMVQALEMFGNLRDQMQEQMFHAIYGSPLVQAFYGISAGDGPPRPRPGHSPWTQKALEAEITRLKERLTEGGPLEAAARALIYISKGAHRVDARSLEVLQRLLAAHPDITLARFKGVLREQWAILAIDERAAVAALPRLAPPNDAERYTLMEMIKEIVTAAGDPSNEVQSRLEEIGRLLDAGPDKPQAKPKKAAAQKK
jgi:hypothetical protein